MKKRFWKILFPAVIVAAALLGYTAISAQEEYVRGSYEIEVQAPNSELKSACYLENGKLLLIEGSDSEFRGVLTEPLSGRAQILWQISGGFRQLSLLPDRAVIVYETAQYIEGAVRKQAKVVSYDLNNFTQMGKTTVIRGLSSLSAGKFEAGPDGTFYFLKGSEPNILYVAEDVSEDDQEKIQELVPFCDLEEPIINLLSDPSSGDVYAVLQAGGLCRIDASEVTALSGDSVGDDLRMLGTELAMDGNGELFRVSEEYMTVERLYASQSTGAACRYQNGILAEFGSVLLYLDEQGAVLGQVTLEKRSPAYLFADGDMVYSVSPSNHGVRVEYTNGVTDRITVEKFTEESNGFLAAPLPGIYPLPENDSEPWTVALNPELVNSGRGNGAVTIRNEDTGSSFTWTVGNGLEMDGSFLRFPAPEPVESGTYQVELSNLCTAEGLPASCIYTITFTEEASESPDSSGTDNSGSSAGEESSELIASQVYEIDGKTRVLTGVEPGSTLAQIKANLQYNGELVVRNFQGTRVSSGGVGTGTTFTLLQNGIQSDQVTLLIYGDLNGDGSVNEKDVSVLVEHEFYHERRTVLKGVFLEAADINRDGDYSFEDLNLLYKSIYEYGVS